MLSSCRVAAAALLAALYLAAQTRAGPLGPFPNVTSAEIGQKEGSCLVGDVVYAADEEVPGATPCERCRCVGAAVRCDAVSCEPRPGCKALHRPDQCCPIYQCECEQEGRVYGNGEKLVDPQDPCRVCYCQGGEVVCRRIACFVRDDCRPRRVPGRCCPEYDNCPLRGVTSIPGAAGNLSLSDSAPPEISPENIKQEITIKEITPVSEIPVVTDVKIKEIIPSPSIEVLDYTSSKSPLFVREATTEKTVSSEIYFKTEMPAIIEIHSPTVAAPSIETTKLDSSFGTVRPNDDLSPSKISLSTQDSINSEIYPSFSPHVVSTAAPPLTAVGTSTTMKAPEEEDPTMLDHNPAFPPIPDDLSVIGSNHDDETMPGQIVDSDHAEGQYDANTSHMAPSTVAVTLKESPTTSTPEIIVTDKVQEQSSTHFDATTESARNKESPMLNLRSAIPTEILNAPSSLPEDINGELDETTASSDARVATHTDTPNTSINIETSSNTNNDFTTIVYPVSTQQEQVNRQTTQTNINTDTVFVSAEDTTSSLSRGDKKESTSIDISTSTLTNVPTESNTTPKPQLAGLEFKPSKTSTDKMPELSTSTLNKISTETSTNENEITIGTSYAPKTSSEITSQTELSSLPVETSDQNPQESIREKISISTSEPFSTDTPKTVSTSPEVVTVYRELPTTSDNKRFENYETTEFVLTSFGSAESATDAVELIKISADADKNAAIIAEPTRKPNVLFDLSSLVDDFAAIGDKHQASQQTTASPVLPGSEELIPLNAGYKSKNNNYNLNSITEVSTKDKKTKIEIDDDDSSITDSPPPHDKVEPTTRLPIIDNVSDDTAGNKTAKKDIEILTQSYVPTISLKPTKVIMKKSQKPAETSLSVENFTPSTSDELTEKSAELSKESLATADVSSTVTDRSATSTFTMKEDSSTSVNNLVTTREPALSTGGETATTPAVDTTPTTAQ